MINPDYQGQSINSEPAFKGQPGGAHPLSWQQTKKQNIARGQIPHGQGRHFGAIAGAKPAFEINGPNLVGLPGLG
jgi:hypothetical protein